MRLRSSYVTPASARSLSARVTSSVLTTHSAKRRVSLIVAHTCAGGAAMCCSIVIVVSPMTASLPPL